jgi:hypothetical protein
MSRARAPALPSGYSDPVLLGKGQWGTIWRARQEALGRDVALKVARTPGVTASGKMEEARRQASIASTLVPAVYDAFPWQGQVCISMEWLQGVTLERLLQAGALSEAAAWHFARTLATGLERLHRVELAHGDLKPANLMILQDGQIRLLDLGFSHKPHDPAHPQGTPAYLPPESFRGETSPLACDLWALGVILCEALLGRRPDVTEGPGDLLSSLSLHPHLHPLWVPLLLAGLDPDPSRRWHSPRDWLEQLDAIGPFPNGQEELARLCRPVFEHEMSQACLAAGQDQLRRSNPASAFRLVSEALEWDPDHWPAMELLGKIELGAPRRRKWPFALAAALALTAGSLGFLAGRTNPRLPVAPPALAEPKPEILAPAARDSLDLGAGPGFSEGVPATLLATLSLPDVPAGCTLFVDGTPRFPQRDQQYSIPSGHHLLQVGSAGAILWQRRIKAVAYQRIALRTSKGKLP